MEDNSKLPKRVSAGLLMYRIKKNETEVLLAHPGGPFFRNKDDGHWSIPKGEPSDKESDLLETAKREFEEETGITALWLCSSALIPTCPYCSPVAISSNRRPSFSSERT